ncbi:MAG: hypothetical protein ABIP75_09305 [Pyrinomonadaceae bacterium]
MDIDTRHLTPDTRHPTAPAKAPATIVEQVLAEINLARAAFTG